MVREPPIPRREQESRGRFSGFSARLPAR